MSTNLLRRFEVVNRCLCFDAAHNLRFVLQGVSRSFGMFDSFRVIYLCFFSTYFFENHPHLFHHSLTFTCLLNYSRVPHHTTPHHTTPHHTTPHQTTPHHTTPHLNTPHHTTPHLSTLRGRPLVIRTE